MATKAAADKRPAAREPYDPASPSAAEAHPVELEPTPEENALYNEGVAAGKNLHNDLDERIQVSTDAAESLIDRAAKATGQTKDAIQHVSLAADPNRPGANALVTFATTGSQVYVNLDSGPDDQGYVPVGGRVVDPIFPDGENPLTPPAVMTDPITATNPISGSLVDGKSVVKDVPAAVVSPLESLALTVGIKADK